MRALRNGLLAGLFAGLALAMFNFVQDGAPGRTLPDALHWFGISLSDGTTSKYIGFILFIVLGSIAGLVYGLLQRGASTTLPRALSLGLLIGFAWWFVLPFLLNNITHHSFAFSFSDTLRSLPIDLLFGVVLGAAYFQWQGADAKA
ncbi:MAG TPA: hypothetical protein VGT44_19065 [Ktedonobacteraceae bacterium]|nr:hypothetical protein [Ktedonobacteraceae bacterium]